MSLSEAATPSPRGLAKLRTRSKGFANTSTSSLPGSSGGDSDDPAGKAPERLGEDGGLRASMESAIDKVKERTRRKSVDDRGGSVSNLLSKAKRKVRRADRDDNLERNMSIDSGKLDANTSDSSMMLDESRRSSLFTEDERQDDDGKPIRPSLSPHDSHAGYLTLSSPEINAQTTPVIAGADLVASPDSELAPDPLVNVPQIIEPTDHNQTVEETAPASSTTTLERTTSPAGKLRGPLSLSRKKSKGSDSVKTVGSGTGSLGGLGGLFKSSSRRNSLNTQSQSETASVEEAVTAGAPQEGSKDKDSGRPETPQQRGRPLIDTKVPSTPPNLLEAPITLVTPPTPTDFQANAGTFSKPTPSQKGTPSPRSFGTAEGIKHRRTQSANIPSKLSTSINPPLTPTVEETKTPGGTLTQPSLPNNATGFFSSVFSAAQKAGAQFSNSINTTILPAQKSKPSTGTSIEAIGGEEVIPGIGSRPTTGVAGERRPLAVETLGKGDLNFSHLGISESADTNSMTSTESQQNGGLNKAQSVDQSRKAEEDAAARAVSSAYEKPLPSAASTTGRPMSIGSTDKLTLNGDQTPPRPIAVDTDASGIKRSGSVRSKLSGRRKHRGSSAATSNSIAAALKDTSAGLANVAVHGAGHRLTGFAVASSKRNKDFHQLFRSVPEDDYLIEDYSAALQRDILLHGRLYVSEGHICFSSNILGWVTNLVISFDEVVSVEKKSTAVIFPNAIVISTLHARNTFASFVARDSTYELLIGIWKISHPNLKSSLNGVVLDDAGTGDKTERADPELTEGETSDGSEDEIYDEDADDDGGSFTDAGMAASVADSEVGDMTISRKTSAIPASIAPQANGLPPKGLEGADAVVTGAAISSDFPGVATHEPTQCTETGEHYDRPLTDTTIPAPLGKIYSMMFGPASGAFMRKWLVEDQKSRDLNYTDDKIGLDNDHQTFTFDYIKPLSAPVGPKQTKCITTSTLKAFDLEKAVSVDHSTQTPDVPSGNVFTTKTRCCLMWGPNNSTRIVATCTIEWTGKSWLKSPIEKGAEQGQIEYFKSLVASLKSAVTTKPPVKGLSKKGKRKGKKEVFDAEEAITQREATIAAEQKQPSWGVLEPLHQILEPIIALIRPFVTSQVIIAVLFVLLAYTWFMSSRGGSAVSYPGYSSPERIAAYEEIWRREESALWDWLEDRVGIDSINTPPLGNKQNDRQKVLQAKKMGKKLDDERMSDRQMEEQLRTTEEKLEALREAVNRRKARRNTA